MNASSRRLTRTHSLSEPLHGESEDTKMKIRCVVFRTVPLQFDHAQLLIQMEMSLSRI